MHFIKKLFFYILSKNGNSSTLCKINLKFFYIFSKTEILAYFMKRSIFFYLPKQKFLIFTLKQESLKSFSFYLQQKSLKIVLYTRFFNKKTIFLPEPQFSQHNGRNQAEIFLIFFLTFIFIFSLNIYLIRFNTNNKRHSLNNEDR